MTGRALGVLQKREVLSHCRALGYKPEVRAMTDMFDGFMETVSDADRVTVAFSTLRDCANRGDTVYFMRCGEFVKIGYEKGKHGGRGRLWAAELLNPYDLEIVALFDGCKDAEQMLHAIFAPWHHRREWFRIDGALRDFIAETQGSIADAIAA